MHKSMAIMFGSIVLLATELYGIIGPEDSVMQAIRPGAIAAHVKFLADDLLEGRGTGTRGYDLAAKYVASQFESLALEPAGAKGTYFQPIRFRTTTVVPDATSIRVTSTGYEEQLVWGRDYFTQGDPFEEVSSISGQVVFVGQGIISPDYRIDDYNGVDVRGKIVAFVSGSPDRLPPEERAHFSTERTKLAIASSRGAVGAIRVWNGSDNNQAFLRASSSSSTAPAMAWLDEKGFPYGHRTEIRTWAVLSESGTKKLFQESFRPAQKATVLPVTVLLHTTSKYAEVVSPNVVGLWRGSDPRLQGEYVVYSAHLDHLGIGLPVNGDSIYNGATDNAGSVAALIEIARAFTTLQPKQRRSVLFLAVTGEEKGLLGSDYFAENPTVPRSQLVANVNMDGLNLLFDFANIVDIGGEHSTLGAVFRRAAAKLNVEPIPDPSPEQQIFVRSDQYSFVRRGIPALFPRTGTKALDPKIDASHMEADRMQFRHHSPNDDLNQPLDFVAGAKTAQFNFLLGYYIAQDEDRPHWNDHDFFARTFAAQPK